MATPSPATDPAAELSATLRARGQRVTPQRLVIHAALGELDRHVTAEDVLEAVSERLPHVSAPTIYATLELFDELGLVRRLARPGGPTLYEPRSEPHQHAVCTTCGGVEDLATRVDAGPALRAARRTGFVPQRGELTVTGTCARCAARHRGRA